jgi:hypothetical protein
MPKNTEGSPQRRTQDCFWSRSSDSRTSGHELPDLLSSDVQGYPFRNSAELHAIYAEVTVPLSLS